MGERNRASTDPTQHRRFFFTLDVPISFKELKKVIDVEVPKVSSRNPERQNRRRERFLHCFRQERRNGIHTGSAS